MKNVNINSCTESLVDDLLNTIAGYPTAKQMEEQRHAEERIKEKAKRLEEIKKAKQVKIPPSNEFFSNVLEDGIKKLANKFNQEGVK